MASRANDYKYCAQIMVSHIRKTNAVHSKLLDLLNKDFNLFGRILELKVLKKAKHNSDNQKDTIAFLTYVRNASHWEAIEHYNGKGLYFMDKKLYFRPSAFTNEEFHNGNTDYSTRCVRLGQFGMPLNGSTERDNAVTRDREIMVTRRLTANNIITILNQQPNEETIDRTEKYKCVKCDKVQEIGDFVIHKAACTGLNELETKVLRLADVIRNQLTQSEHESSLIRFMEEQCSICHEAMLLSKSKDIKTLVCGHRIHLECYENLIANGIPCPKQRFDYGIDTISQLPVVANIVETEVNLADFSNKIYACPLCRAIGTSTLLNFTTGRKWYYQAVDLVEIDNDY